MQIIKRETTITPIGTSLSYGYCSFTCIPSATTFCCNTDLCNAYDTTLNHGKCDNYQSYEINNRMSNKDGGHAMPVYES
jgi:hypothetical protein